MSYIAKVKFTGEVNKKPVLYRAGDKISDAAAKELDLANKPLLAIKAKPTK
tara:strand:+ start:170 stop:322 length:153 start_codon:yes stop_codon:yes gene_type:complete